MIRLRRTNSVGTRAFTLVELLVSISVVFLIMGIALVAYTSAVRSAKSAADRAAVNGLRIAVGQFKAEFGFVPPMVKDEGDINLDATAPFASVRGRLVPLVYSAGSPTDADVLRGRDTQGLPRYSLLSIPYYLMGALDAEFDGVDGLGFYEVRRDGTFAPTLAYEAREDDPAGSPNPDDLPKRSQRRYEPFFDTSRGSAELYLDASTRLRVGGNGVLIRDRTPFKYELRDRAGIGIRYYRWTPDETPLADLFSSGSITDIASYTDPEDSGGLEGEAGYYNVPPLVLAAVSGEDGAFPVELRTATYAIVAAGPNQLFGDEVGSDGSEIDQALQSDAELRRRYAEQLGLSESRLQGDADYRAEAIAAAIADNIVEVGS